MSWQRAAWAAVSAAYAATLVWAATALPERVASHFGASGAADGWSSRTEHLVFSGLLGVVVVIGLPLLVAGLARGSGAFINVPHKDYWLDDAHPGRRVEFRRRLIDDLCAIAALTGLLLIWMQLETVWANRQEPPRLSSLSMVAIIAYVVAVLGLSAWIATRRYRPPAQEPGTSGPLLPT